MKTLEFAEGLALPIEAVTEKLAFLGRTGSGKTYAAMKLAELFLAAGAQIGALDPVGVWRALRVPSAKDGRAFEVVVFGGQYGDVPLEPSAGALIADVICDRGISFVLDLSPWIPSEQQRFVRAFAARFFHRRKQAPAAVHLFMEECQEFLPQHPQGDEAMTLHEFQRLWKIGRNFGIGGSLISQRPQEINKKALNMTGTLFAFQMNAPQERKAIKEWIADQGIAADISSVLQKLKVGQPHIESPTFLEVSGVYKIRPRETADLSSTPKVGAGNVAKRPLTRIDVAAITAAMGDAVARAKADDPRELRKQLAEQGKQLSAKDAQLRQLQAGESKQGNKITAPNTPALTAADRELLAALREDFRTFSDDIAGKADAMLQAIADRATAALGDVVKQWTDVIDKRRELFLQRLEKARLQGVLDKIDKAAAPAPAMSIHPPNVAPATRQALEHVGRAALAAPAPPLAIEGKRDPAVGNSGLSKMLIALAQRPKGLTRAQLGIRAGLSPRTGTFATYLGKLRSQAWVEDVSDHIRITLAGLEALGSYTPLPEGDALAAYWQRELGGGAARILKAVVDAHPRVLTREEIGAAADLSPATGTFATYLGKLRGLELITGRGDIRASEELFS